MKKKVAISQSNYIPWKGYFDSMKQVDVFVLYDDVQYTKRDWRNRNKIKTPHGLRWLTIPVEVKGKYHQKIKDVKVSDKEWNKKHWDVLILNYKQAKGFTDVRDFLEDLYRTANYLYLSEINYHFLENIAKYLGINVDFKWSSEFKLAEERNERLLNICLDLCAEEYYTGQAAKNYLKVDMFEKKNIKLNWMDYSNYLEYEQLFPPFEHQVSILDVIFNTGIDSKFYITNKL